MTDSPRYCATHDAYGDHHTDRCPDTYGRLSVDERQALAVQEQIQRSRAQAQARAVLEPQASNPTFTVVDKNYAYIGLTFALCAVTFFLAGHLIVALACLASGFNLARLGVKYAR